MPSLDTAIKVGAVVSSLSGFGALATLTGAAITWTRFHGAHVPVDQAVAAVSPGELVVIGAVMLATFALASVVAVLVAYLLDPEGRPGTENLTVVTLLATAGLVVAVLLSQPDGRHRTLGACAVAVACGVMVLLMARVAWKSSSARSATGRKDRLGRGLVTTIVAGAVAAIFAGVLWLLTEHAWVGAMTLVTAALAGLGLQVAKLTDSRFRWYGVGIFLGIVTWGSILETLRTLAEVKLQPLAIVRTADAGGNGLAGYYVARTSDTVLLAYVDRCDYDAELRLRPTKRSKRGRLVELPRSSVEAMSIGKRVRLELADDQGPLLLAELYERLGRTPSAQAAQDRCAREGILDRAARETTGVPAREARRLAQRFRPRLLFDSKEPWRPLRIESLVAERTPQGKARHRICARTAKATKQGPCDPLLGVNQLSDPTAPARVIDLGGTRLGGSDHRTPSLGSCPGAHPAHLLDCDRGAAAAIYYNVTRANGRAYVDYWWFLRYNRFADRGLDDVCATRLESQVIGCFDHEGDWEGVTVVTTQGRQEKLAYVGLAAHSGVFRFAASELKLDGDRPRIHIARGSHASYPRACPRRCVQFTRKLGIKLPETQTDGEQPWGSNDDDGALMALRPAWRSFDGRWGSPICSFSRKCVFGSGPKSPARQLRHRRPWCHTGAGGTLECDGTPPAPARAVPADEVAG